VPKGCLNLWVEIYQHKTLGDMTISAHIHLLILWLF